MDGREIIESIAKRQGLLTERSKNNYTFSHLTLHEHLAAGYYHAAGRPLSVAAENLADQRWREVILLLAGRQLPDADTYLLHLMDAAEKRIMRGVAAARVHGFLCWLTEAVQPSDEPQTAASRRAIAVQVLLPRVLQQGLADIVHRSRDPEIASDIHLAIELFLNHNRNGAALTNRQRSIALDLAYGHVRELALALALDLDRAITLTLDRAIALDRALTLDRAIALDCWRNFSLDLARHQVFPEAVIARAEAQLSSLRMRDINQQEFIDDIQNVIPDAVGLPAEFHAWQVEDLASLIGYLNALCLVTEAKAAALRVTTAGWDLVCARLLHPTSDL